MVQLLHQKNTDTDFGGFLMADHTIASILTNVLDSIFLLMVISILTCFSIIAGCIYLKLAKPEESKGERL
jgi:hypothetical protein